MKKQPTYVLELDGVKVVYLDIDDLCESLKCEFEEVSDLKYEVYIIMMTAKEIEEMPEFDGF